MTLFWAGLSLTACGVEAVDLTDTIGSLDAISLSHVDYQGAFDNDTTTGARRWLSKGRTAWVIWDFGEPTVVTGYRIMPTVAGYYDASRNPQSFELFGTNGDPDARDGWVLLDAQVTQKLVGSGAGTSWYTYHTKPVNQTAYRYYKFSVSVNGGSGEYTALQELELFNDEPSYLFEDYPADLGTVSPNYGQEVLQDGEVVTFTATGTDRLVCTGYELSKMVNGKKQILASGTDDNFTYQYRNQDKGMVLLWRWGSRVEPSVYYASLAGSASAACARDNPGTIAEAISKCVSRIHWLDGDRVVLLDGIYSLENDITVGSGRDYMTVTTESGDPQRVTVRSTNGSSRFITISGSRIRLENLTVEQFGAATMIAGGAVYIGESPATKGTLISNCVFRMNSANGYTGGALHTLSDSCEVVDCTFEDNTCGVGGEAIYGKNLRVVNSRFRRNISGYSDHTWGCGGAIFGRNGENTYLLGCEIVENSAVNRGGAVECQLGLGTVILLR